jgi:hypothetical protein
MKKILKSCILLFLYNISYGQEITINKYLNGIWKMQCCSEFFEIYFDNKIYFFDRKGGTDTSADKLYCFPKANFFPETPLGLNYDKDLKPDSIDYDRQFKLIEGEEIVEIVFYDEDDKLVNGNIKHTGPDYYQIDPTKPNYFTMWGHENSQKLVYYDRILQPAPFLVTFYKNVAKSNFKKVTSLKTYINSLINKSTNMYLIKDDEVEIIEEKENWLHIRYYGKKTIEGWIKKSDVE